MVATFDNTVAILVKAYLEGSLQKGNCHACAVGNICAAALSISVLPTPISEEARSLGFNKDFDWAEQAPHWQSLFYTEDGVQRVGAGLYKRRGAEQIEAAGYSIEQLARVEFAFETAAPGYTEEDEYAGLMAVVDVLADIHGIDLAAAEASKLLFVKA